MRLMPMQVVRRLLRLTAGAAVIVTLLGADFPCRAQQVTATLSGTVRDTSGAVVPQAALTATNVSTGVAVKTLSDSAGNYIFPSLAPATYTLAAEKSGFSTTVISGISLAVYEKATVDVVLRVGQTVQTVEVKGAAPLVSTTSASVGTLINEQQTVDLPLNLRRTSELALLVPAVANTSGNSLTSASGNGSGFNQTSFSSVGGTSASNLVLIDGMINRALNNGGFALDLAPEMVKEFKIQNNVYDAQYGFTAGAVMNMVTPAGTNRFNGAAWNYLRNQVLDARNFFALDNTDPITGAEIPGSARPAYIRNQFGFAAGGPIRKDKTFIFGSYEGLRHSQGSASLSSVPTAEEAAGNFNSFLTGNIINLCGAGGPANLNFDSGQLFAPASEYLVTCPNGSALAGSAVLAGQPIPGNMITNLSPFAQKVLAAFPAPNYPGSPNFINTTPYRERDDTALLRVDETLSAKDQLFAHYIFGNSNEFYPGYFNPFNSSQHYRGQNAVVAWTHTFSPTLLGEARVGVARDYLVRNCAECPWPAGTLAGFGIQGVSATSPQTELEPEVTFNNFASFGDYSYNPDVVPDMVEKYEGSLTKIHGRHTIVTGADTNFYQLLGYGDPKQLNGLITFNGQYSSLAGETPDNSLVSDLADMELGFPASGSYMKNAFTNEYVGGGMFGVFAQDSFHVSDSLSLEFGLRWEYRKQPHDKHNNIATMFPLRNSFTPGDALLLSGLPDAANDALCSNPYFLSATGECLVMSSAQRSQYGLTGGKRQEVSLGGGWDSFAPRVGISWRPTRSNKFVIHTGAGIFYDLPETNQLVAYNNNNPVDSQTLSYNPATGEPPPLTNGAPTTTNTMFAAADAAGTVGSATGQLMALPFYFTPTVYEWSFTVDSQFAKNWALEVGYLGNRGVHIPCVYFYGNQAQPGVGDIGPRRVWPDFGPFTYNTYDGLTRYNALTARLTKNLSQGLSLLLSYTYGKAMAFNGGDTDSRTLVQDSNHPQADYSAADTDVPQQLTISPIWQLPLGKGQHFLNRPGWVNGLVGGWEFSGILTFQAGSPFTVISPEDYSNTDSGSPRPDRTCNGAGPRTVAEWFNTNCFTTALLAQALENGTPRFGNSGHNILFGPGINEWDVSFIKRTRISERFSLEFRAQFFNVFNHANFGNPAGTTDSTGFGEITSAATPRDIQFGLKLNF
ncbi:MAG TPA: carboxypeptidase-like regulatory domain-containing protein [Terriglobia bacterium]|nr:carboxypeptidase-like regulatory domain-containing protein [Terriglobia bacterium]